MILLWFLGCSPEKSPITDANALVTIGTDTLYFDSVFASTRSITLATKIFNPNRRPIEFSSISLAGANASAFRINVDGMPGPALSNVRIPAQDSIYLFATVQPQPNGGNGVFLASDSVQLVYNGQRRFIQLRAEVRNAFFVRQAQISTDTTWSAQRPIIITRALTVAAGATLRIQPGAQVYAGAGAPLVVQGRLLAEGTNAQAGRIEFAGDRLDEPYKSFPAGWPGIVLGQQSSGSVLRHVRLRNAYQALVLLGAGQGSTPKLLLDKCTVENIYDAAITALASSLVATNSLILNAGQNVVLRGGSYQFVHCTVATFQSLYIDHNLPVLQLTTDVNGQQTAALQASFANCIFWGVGGRAESEISTSRQGNTPFDAGFTNCLYRMKEGNPPHTVFTASLRNQDPLFDTINAARNIYVLKLRPASPCINAGAAAAGLPTDIDGKPRTNLPDIGCYEF